MPITVSTNQKRILLQVKNSDPEEFKTLVSIIKNYQGSWSPESKMWSIKPNYWSDVCSDLEVIDDLKYLPEVEQQISKLVLGVSSIKYFDDAFSRKDLKLPPILGKAPFENYQLEDISNAFNTNRYAFFNDPGTGKTYDYMSVIELQRKYRGAGKIVFLTSNSGVYNMRKEFSKFTFIPEGLISVGGIKNRRPFDDLDKEVVVFNYRSFLLVYDEYNKKRDGTPGKGNVKFIRALDKWLGNRDGILILDESHHIANPSSQQSDAVHHITQLFEYIYEGSGTPADKLEKWYSQLKALDKTLVEGLSFTDWKNKYFFVGTTHGASAVSDIKPDMAPKLQSIVKSVSVRRLAEDILDLPPHTFKKFYTEFTDPHRNIYEKVISGALQEIQEEYGAVVARKVEGLFPYMVMSVDNPHGLIKHFGGKITDATLIKDIEKFSFLRDHAKVSLIEDILLDHPNKKFILWTSHPAVAEYLNTHFSKRRPFVINGETRIPSGMDKDEYKLKIVEEFQSNKSRNLLIAGTQVLNSSVNIVVCNKQIIVDTDYNYTFYEQFIKRINRLGQENETTTFLPLIDKSMDITRRLSMEDKDFINKFFLSEKFLDKTKLRMLFSMEGK